MDPAWLWFARYSAKFNRRKGLCMRLVLERGVPQEERHKVTVGSLTDWDAARVFLEVVRCGSFRSAAERLELSINVVRRRIDDFERQIGATLFTRDVHGTRLTDEGAVVVSAVERMEAASFDLLRAGNSVTNTLSGEVRVAVTEGLGTFWLAKNIKCILPSRTSLTSGAVGRDRWIATSASCRDTSAERIAQWRSTRILGNDC